MKENKTKAVKLTEEQLDNVSGGNGTGSIPFKFHSLEWVSFTLSDGDSYRLYGEICTGYIMEYNGVPEPHYTIAVEGAVGPRPYRNIPEHRICHA